MSVLIHTSPPMVPEPLTHTEEVTINGPLQNEDNPKGPPYRLLIMGGVMALMIGAMVMMMTMSGLDTIKKNPMMGMMFIMMPMMMIMSVGGMLLGSSGPSQTDVDRDRRQYQRQLQEKRKIVSKIAGGQHAVQVFRFPNPRNLANMIASRDVTMWRATYSEDDESGSNGPFMQARIGIGFLALDPPIQSPPAQVLDNLEPFTAVAYSRFNLIQGVVPNAPLSWAMTQPAYGFRGVTGEKRLAVVRAMLLSMMYTHSPNVLTVAVISDRESEWDWVKWAPHNLDTARAMGPGGYGGLYFPTMEAFGAEVSRLRRIVNGTTRRMIVVVDTPSHDAKFRDRALNSGIEGMCLLVVNAISDEALTTLTSRFHISAEGSFSGHLNADVAIADEVTREDAEEITRKLAAYRPPNFGFRDDDFDDTEESVEVPTMVNALGVDDLNDWDVTTMWQDSEWTNTFEAPYGYVVDRTNKETGKFATLNIIELDKKGTGPHGLLSGGTGTGKSHLIRSLLIMLLANYSPSKLVMILMDFKGGATFAPFDGMPHILANISNLKGSADLVARSRDVIEGELVRRQEVLDEYQVGDIYEYRALRRENPSMPPLPDLLILADELREMLIDERNMGFVDVFARVGQIGRSLGVHLLLASQYIDEALIRDAIQHMTYGITLKVGEARHSTAVVKTPDATKLPPNRVALFRYAEMTDERLDRVTAFNWRETYKERHRVSGGTTTIIDGEVVETATESVGGIEKFHLRPASSTYAEGDTNAPVHTSDVEYEYRDTDKDLLTRMIEMIKEAGEPYEGQVYQLWAKPLAVPMTFADYDGDFGRSDARMTLRLGDVDRPFDHKRLPWVLDFTDRHYAVVGDPGTGRSTALLSLLAASAFSYHGNWASWFVYDYSGTTMASAEKFPNVSMYVNGGDDDGWNRMVGEIKRIMALRTTAFNEGRYRSITDYFTEKNSGNRPDLAATDPYNHIFLAIDGYSDWWNDAFSEDFTARDEFQRMFRDMARLGVHAVIAATSDNKLAKATEQFHGNVQLSMAEPGNNPRLAALRGQQYRSLVQSGIPTTQPGRGANFDYLNESNERLALHARVAVPVLDVPEPKSVILGVTTWDYRENWTSRIEELGEGLSQPGQPVSDNRARKVETVSTDMPMSSLLTRVRTDLIRQVPLHQRTVPFGLSRATDYPIFHNPSEHVIIVGDPKSGRTTALRTFMAGVMSAYTSQEARFIVMDPEVQMISEVDFLTDTGYLKQGNYLTDRAEAGTVIERLITLVKKRLRDQTVTKEAIENRSYVTGPEIFVFIDGMEKMSQGAGLGAPDGSLEKLVATLPSYDVGIHLIYTMTAATFQVNQTRSRVLKPMMEEHPLRYMLLSGSRGYGKPFLGTNLYFDNTPAGRAKWVEKSSYATEIVQVAHAAEHG